MLGSGTRFYSRQAGAAHRLRAKHGAGKTIDLDLAAGAARASTSTSRQARHGLRPRARGRRGAVDRLRAKHGAARASTSSSRQARHGLRPRARGRRGPRPQACSHLELEIDGAAGASNSHLSREESGCVSHREVRARFTRKIAISTKKSGFAREFSPSECRMQPATREVFADLKKVHCKVKMRGGQKVDFGAKSARFCPVRRRDPANPSAALLLLAQTQIPRPSGAPRRPPGAGSRSLSARAGRHLGTFLGSGPPLSPPPRRSPDATPGFHLAIYRGRAKD